MSEDALVERLAEAISDPLIERQQEQEILCPRGCGCRKQTDDPDRSDCACDGPCSMDERWWDGLSDAEHLARAVLPIVEDHAKAERKAGAVDALREVQHEARGMIAGHSVRGLLAEHIALYGRRS